MGTCEGHWYRAEFPVNGGRGGRVLHRASSAQLPGPCYVAASVWYHSASSGSGQLARAQNHYDNLKVSRDAPIEVIRAAYATLAAKYLPGLQRGSEEAGRVVAIINKAYAVLSDPMQRRLHDEWIAEIEMESPKLGDTSPPPASQSGPATGGRRQAVEGSPARPGRHRSGIVVKVLGFVAAFIVVFGAVLALIRSNRPRRNNEHASASLIKSESSPLKEAKPEVQNAKPKVYDVVPVLPEYTRAALAPNGEPWPTNSGYLDGFEQQNSGGRSNLTVDNSKSESDALVSVYDHVHDRPMRVFFLRGGDQFTATELLPGEYDVRNMDLDSGVISRSEPFEFREIHDQDGVHWHDSTVRLYKERDPKHAIRFETIGPNEFVKMVAHQ